MSHFIKVSIWLVLIISLVIPIKATQATIINYEATDLANITSGEDLWQYTYTVSDYTFAKDTGFTIYFDDAIEIFPLSSNLNWDILTWDPDLTIPDHGAYDALALENNASLTDPFMLSFVWLGISPPGPQDFQVYSLIDGFEILESGRTVAAATPVPEPATLLLLGSVLAGLLGFKRFKPQNN